MPARSLQILGEPSGAEFLAEHPDAPALPHLKRAGGIPRRWIACRKRRDRILFNDV
jgi:hypothetical protein